MATWTVDVEGVVLQCHGAGVVCPEDPEAPLLAVVVTGFMSEALHYARLEPHRQIAYFLHLVVVFALLMYLPYSKFAHLIYRTTAMVYAECSGRNAESLTHAAIDEHQSGGHASE